MRAVPQFEQLERLAAVSLKFCERRMSLRIGVCFFFGFGRALFLLLNYLSLS
jgi:hypothetical protein